MTLNGLNNIYKFFILLKKDKKNFYFGKWNFLNYKMGCVQLKKKIIMK